MYRNGAFKNLVWSRAGVNHQHQWDYIKSYFGFSDEFISPICSTDFAKAPLDYLAKTCISQCWDLLFSLTPLEYLPGNLKNDNDKFDFHPSIRLLMGQSLTQALSTHLIMTFAYRFFCENLVPKSLAQYSNAIYEYRNSHGSSKDRDQIREEKKTAYNNLKRKYADFCKALGVVTPSSILPTVESERDSLFSCLQPTIADEIAFRNFKDTLARELDIETIPPPSAPFLMFFLSERNRFWGCLTHSKDRFLELTTLLSEAEMIHLLITGDQGGVQKSLPPYPILCPNSAVVQIPVQYNPQNKFHGTDTSYQLKEHDKGVRITSRLQLAFNNYIIERNFHLHAMATAESYMIKHPAGENDFVKSPALIPLQLNASLMQSPFISFLDNLPSAQHYTAVIDHYVKRWNRLALPILEEMFIFGVWKTIPSAETISEEILKWMDSDLNFMHVNFFRLFPAEKITYPQKDSVSQKRHNTIARYAFQISDHMGTSDELLYYLEKND